jgi:hypothetical protein
MANITRRSALKGVMTAVAAVAVLGATAQFPAPIVQAALTDDEIRAREQQTVTAMLRVLRDELVDHTPLAETADLHVQRIRAGLDRISDQVRTDHEEDVVVAVEKAARDRFDVLLSFIVRRAEADAAAA